MLPTHSPNQEVHLNPHNPHPQQPLLRQLLVTLPAVATIRTSIIMSKRNQKRENHPHQSTSTPHHPARVHMMTTILEETIPTVLVNHRRR